MSPTKCRRCGLMLIAGAKHATAQDCLDVLRPRYEIDHRELLELRKKLRTMTGTVPQRTPAPSVLSALLRIEQRLNFLIGQGERRNTA